MKGNGKALLTEARYFLNVAENECSLRNEYMLAVLTVDGIRNHYLDRPCKLAIETVRKHRVDGRSLENDIGLAVGRVDVHLWRAFAAGG